MKKVYTLVFNEGVFITDLAHSFVDAMKRAEAENYDARKLKRASVWREEKANVRSINFVVKEGSI